MYSESENNTIRMVMESHDPYKVVSEVASLLKSEKSKREEFYNMVHENVHAEFIAGEIVFHSPTRSRHWQLVVNLATELNTFVKKNKLGRIGIDKVMITIGRNDFEPDIVFFRTEVAETFEPSQKLFPAPHLAVEVLSESTKERDRGIKLREYALGGVEEYWIVDGDRNILEQYMNVGAEFVLHKQHGPSGHLECKAVPGFRLNLTEVFAE